MSGESNEVRWRGVRPINGIQGIWPARNAVRVSAYKSKSGLGVEIVYTVGVGKKLFISQAQLTTSASAAAATWSVMRMRDDGDVGQSYVIIQSLYSVGTETNIASFLPALEVLAGWDVFIETGIATNVVRGLIHGWLEDA